jgi:prepilin-type N-terminal cleavage/methylation domain-containing protein
MTRRKQRAAGQRSRRPDASRRQRGGFTLIEMMFAMVIMAAGLLAMLAVQVQALQQGRYGRHTTEAMQLGRDQMERFMRLPWDDAAVQPVAWTVPTPMVMTVQNDTGAVAQQTFNVSWRIQAAAFEPNARTVDIDITWVENDVGANFPRRYVLSSLKNNEG